MLGVKGMELVWFHVTDWNRSKQFYTETLGMQITFVDEEMGWMELRDPENLVVLALKKWTFNEPMPTGGGGCPIIQVEDLASTKEELETRGVEFAGPVIEVQGIRRLATFYDPDGNPVSLTQIW